jgi:hypothetical protein
MRARAKTPRKPAKKPSVGATTSPAGPASPAGTHTEQEDMPSIINIGDQGGRSTHSCQGRSESPQFPPVSNSPFQDRFRLSAGLIFPT